MSDSFNDHAVDGVIQKCPLHAPAAETHWIEIELIGEDDGPIPWEEYVVELPSGRHIRGFLDERGVGRLERLEETGTCRVSFPKIDRDAWREM
ncbi:MAG: hypothetical protein ACKV2U_01640 [Bryobacteraceae bacterium]